MKDAGIFEKVKNIEREIRELCDKRYRDGVSDGFDDGYNQGYFDAKGTNDDEIREQGRKDAWECARKMMLSDEDGGIALSDILKIFGMTQYSAIKRFSASEAIAKIKEYEEKQKMVEDAEIKVGDEVIYCGGGAHDGSVGVVIGTEKDWVEVKFKSSWNCVGICKDTLTKTGRHFPQIAEVLEQMKQSW